MQKAIIFYTDGTSHKLFIEGVTVAKFTELIKQNIRGYPRLTVDHVAQWIER